MFKKQWFMKKWLYCLLETFFFIFFILNLV